jgi:hypothetical protein
LDGQTCWFDYIGNLDSFNSGKLVQKITLTGVVAPHSLPDFYVVNFKMDGTQETLMLHQPAIGHLLFGTVHMLTDWEADYQMDRSLNDAMKNCLNTQSPFFDEMKSLR